MSEIKLDSEMNINSTTLVPKLSVLDLEPSFQSAATKQDTSGKLNCRTEINVKK